MSTTAVISSCEEAADGDSGTGLPAALLSRARANLHFRSRWAELNGAMGDLGTYIPIVMALTLAKNLDLGTTLIFTGVYNIITGAIYGVPMPVQPMKSIAAVAISTSSFGVPEIMAAGICTSGVLFVLGATRLMGLVYKFVPLPVVRGIRLGQGLSFAVTAVKYLRYVHDLAKGKSFGQRPWLGLDGLVLAIAATIFVVVVNGAGEADGPVENRVVEEGDRRRLRGKFWRKVISSVPSAVVVFVLGVVLAVVRQPSMVKELKAGPSRLHVVKISKQAWKEGFVKGAVPQLPLSVLNSVIAVCKLTTNLFPDKVASATSVSVTVGLMNLVGCWFGAMPCCHGAGGWQGSTSSAGAPADAWRCGGGEAGGGAAAGGLTPAAAGGVPGGAAGPAAAVRGRGAGHGGAGHGVQGPGLRHARLYRCVVRGTWLRLRHGRPRVDRSEAGGDEWLRRSNHTTGRNLQSFNRTKKKLENVISEAGGDGEGVKRKNLNSRSLKVVAVVRKLLVVSPVRELSRW